MSIDHKRFAVIGAGFWANFQLGAWTELAGVECVAVCDRDPDRAKALASRYGVPAWYTNAVELFGKEQLDFVDVITPPEAHEESVKLAAMHRIPVICQKPMATSLEIARSMVETCRTAGVQFLIHENWRWQNGMRRVKEVLDSGAIGATFHAHINHMSSYPVFSMEPGLKEWEKYIIADMGVHLLDIVRFYFGEARSLYCVTHKVVQDIKGEDVACIMLKMRSGTSVVVETGFAPNHREHDIFPETYVFIEGTEGTLELARDFTLKITTGDGTHSVRNAPPRYWWGEPDYIISNASLVPCNAHQLSVLRGETKPETSAEDNLKTLELTFGAYESARTDTVFRFGEEGRALTP